MATPTPAQITAINDTLAGLGFMQKAILTDLVKKLPDVLQPDELPEKMLGGIRQGASDEHLLIVTNLRILLVHKPPISFSGKLKMKEAAWTQVTGVEWRSGLLVHHLIVHQGRKKWDCEIPGINGKGRGIEMAEYLETKIPSPSDSKQTKSLRDPKMNKLQTIERMVHHEHIPGSEWKQLPDILQQEEMPELLAHGEYDDRNGLKVSSVENKIGLLAATDRRLVFVSKPPIGRRKVYEFAYKDIAEAKLNKGLMMGALTIRINGRTEIFRAPNPQVEQVARHLEGKVG